MRSGLTSRSAARRAIVALALLAYVPLLLSHPGRIPADTKLGLTLDPARLMATSVRSWDTSQFAGWVPHQSISYLWPSGPFYWLVHAVGFPMWVVQRLWVGSLLFAAGAGVWWFVRRRGYSVQAALVAALLYQLSPYVLPYVSRTSAMLLPFAGLGWLMGLTEQAAAARGRRAWLRPTALFGLLIATVGGLNLTATLMIAPGPVLLLFVLSRHGETTWRCSVWTAVRLGAVSLFTSLWWMAMLSMQGRYGAKVLGYSETLQAVSATATAPEVLRGQGYWLSYVHAASGTTTTAAGDYMTSPWLIGLGFVLLGGGLLGLVVLRHRDRMLGALLLLVGVVLAVGVHPIDNASPLMSPLASHSRSSLALSMRSSTRAVPLVLLAVGLGAAALVDATRRVRWRGRAVVGPLFVVLSIANFPALVSGDLADPALLHDQRPPAEWYRAAAALDASGTSGRVLQLPGVESQVFDWGYTVDPPLAWLTNKPMIARDWTPLGSPAAMDLLYAFDDRFQAGTAEPAAIAPLLRFLGADTVLLAHDANAARFSSATPQDVQGALDASPDLTTGAVDGDHITLYDLAHPGSVMRAATRTVVLFGSGDGIVDAAAAGLLDGTEAVLYAADLSDEELAAWADAGATFILTDSNRDRAHQWRGAQDVWGFTETGGPGSDVLRLDSQDARLPVFATERAIDQTTAALDGVTIRATYYGSPVRYMPEYRPSMAGDGDTDTAWLVGVDGGSRVGEQLTVSGATSLLLQQPVLGAHITRIRVESDNGSQIVDLAPGAATPVAVGTGGAIITILAVDDDGPVGFTEVIPSGRPEVVRLPDLRVTPAADDAFAVVLTRLHAAADRGRQDQERTLVRRFTTPTAATADWTVAVRRADDAPLSTGCTTDVLRLDDAPIGLQLTAEDVASLTAGGSAQVHPCAPVALTAGEHELTSAPTPLAVDRAVITAGPAAPTVAAAPVVTVDRGIDTHHVTITGCPKGCWLVFGEGFSPGWSASSGDAALGRHVPVAGGFNGWWVTPDADGTAHVTLHWAGQRPIWIALVVSALSVAVLLLIAFRTRGRRVPASPAPVPNFAAVRERQPLRHVLLVGAAAVAAVAVLVSPTWAALSLPLVAIGAWRRNTRLIGLVSLLVIVGGGAAIAGAQLLRNFAPAFWWPSTFERLHHPMYAAVVLLCVTAAARDQQTADR